MNDGHTEATDSGASKTLLIERRKGGVCFLIAFPVFLLLFFGVYLLWHAILVGIDASSPLSAALRAIGYFVVAPLIALILSSRVYLRLRWEVFKGPWTRCENCGYNLTGNESGVCPECGSEVEQS